MYPNICYFFYQADDNTHHTETWLHFPGALTLKRLRAEGSMADFTASKSGTAYNNSIVFLVPFALPSQNATGTLGHNRSRTTRRNAAISAPHISGPNFGCPEVFPLFSMIISSCDGDNASQSREKPCGFSLGVLL